jgi:hypothetical protein
VDGDGGVLVSHDQPGIGMQARGSRGSCLIAVDQQVRAEGDFGFEGGVAEEGLEVAVVVAGDEMEGCSAEAVEQGFQLELDGRDGEGAVDDVAKED